MKSPSILYGSLLYVSPRPRGLFVNWRRSINPCSTLKSRVCNKNKIFARTFTWSVIFAGQKSTIQYLVMAFFRLLRSRFRNVTQRSHQQGNALSFGRALRDILKLAEKETTLSLK